MKHLNLFLCSIFVFLLTFVASAHAAEVEMPVGDLLAQVVQLIKNFGGLSWYAKVSGIILLLVASMQVSIIRPLWDKLGSAKPYVALGLALLGGIFSLDHITLPGVLAYLSAGAGAILLRQLLDVLKAIPGISSIWVTVFDVLAAMLGGESSAQVQAKKVEKLEAKLLSGKP